MNSEDLMVLTLTQLGFLKSEEKTKINEIKLEQEDNKKTKKRTKSNTGRIG